VLNFKVKTAEEHLQDWKESALKWKLPMEKKHGRKGGGRGAGGY